MFLYWIQFLFFGNSISTAHNPSVSYTIIHSNWFLSSTSTIGHQVCLCSMAGTYVSFSLDCQMDLRQDHQCWYFNFSKVHWKKITHKLYAFILEKHLLSKASLEQSYPYHAFHFQQGTSLPIIKFQIMILLLSVCSNHHGQSNYV